jgi:hypothetical protein
MKDLKQYLDELAGPDHPFSKGIPLAGLPEFEVNREPKMELDEETRLALNQFLRLN